MVWETQSFRFYKPTSKYVVKFNYDSKEEESEGLFIKSFTSNVTGYWESWDTGDLHFYIIHLWVVLI